MSDEEIQADLDDAQADLEKKIGQLKDLLKEKVETVERPFEWVMENLPQLLVGVGLGIALLSFLRRR